MSVIFTESFQRFGRNDFYGGSDDVSQVLKQASEYTVTQGWAWRDYYNSGKSQPDAEVWQPAGAPGQGLITQCGIITDPVSPVKNRISTTRKNDLPINNTSTYQSACRTVIRHSFAKKTSHWFMGFLVRSMAGSSTGVASFYNSICVGGRNAPLKNSVPAIKPIDDAHFVESQDLCCITRAETTDNLNPQSYYPKSVGLYYSCNGKGAEQVIPLKVDTDYYVEIEVNTDTLACNVWVDDFLVMQPRITKDVAESLSSGFAITLNTNGAPPNSTGPKPSTFAALGTMCVSDFYVVDATDTIQPNGRLGPSTRVWGDAPANDIEVAFNRPDGFPSNASVVNQPIAKNDTPTDYLGGEGAGTQDVYGFSKVATSIASKIHGVTVRVRAANGSASSHSISAVARGNGKEVESSLGDYQPAKGFDVRMVSMPTAPDGTAWTPDKVDGANFGVKIDT